MLVKVHIMSFHKIFMKELISAASLAALLPKDVSWILSVKSQGFFFILMNGNPEYSFVS